MIGPLLAQESTSQAVALWTITVLIGVPTVIALGLLVGAALSPLWENSGVLFGGIVGGTPFGILVAVALGADFGSAVLIGLGIGAAVGVVLAYADS